MKKRDKSWAGPVVAWVFIGFLLPLVGTASQLPPEIQADRYLLLAQRQIEEQDYAGAKESLDRILALEAQYGLEIPVEFFFRYAGVLDRLELFGEAVEAVTKYLTLAGRGGEHYLEALELLNKAEQDKAAAAAAAEAARRRAEAARRRAAAAAEERRKIVDALVAGNDFVLIPPGEFRMGSKSSEADGDERPLTKVRISRGFWLGKHEVTQDQWQAVMGSNPSRFSGCGNCPVEQVSWDDAQEFIRRLNAQAGGERFRLPTEAEWEYAARAGTSGDRYGNLDAIAWHGGNSGRRTHPVGRKAPNAWGLHDMLGNVWEWVGDWYGDYPGGSVTDPRGPGSGSARVSRGGSWDLNAGRCRASYRYNNSPGDRLDYLGFRLLRTE